VSCAACHGLEGPLLSARRPSLRARVAHRIRYEPELGEATLCARCHEFTFPVDEPAFPFAWSDEPMQSTLTEWQQSGSEASCQDCHFPLGDHSTPGGHDLDLLRRTVSLQVEEGAVTLTARGAAHSVPTGDPFRRFVVELCGDPGCEEPLARARFGRRFRHGQTTWREVADTRIPPAGPEGHASRTVTVDVDRSPSHYRLWYYVAESRLIPRLAADEFRHLISEGSLP